MGCLSVLDNCPFYPTTHTLRKKILLLEGDRVLPGLLGSPRPIPPSCLPAPGCLLRRSWNCARSSWMECSRRWGWRLCSV